nr:O-antigen ligase family protein [Rubrivivax sp.]
MSLDPRLPLAIAAVAAPTLLAWNVAPSPTFLNQALALFLWGVFVAVAARRTPSREAWRDSAPLVAALALVGAAAAWAGGPGTLPTSLALSAVGAIAAAALLAAAGAAQRHTVEAEPVFAMVAAGLVVAGVAGAAIAVVQVFVPAWTDGDVIARSGLPGRAVGNLRQPNHLSSLLLWAAIAAVALVELKRLPRAAGALLCAAFVAAVVLTGSRTGLVGVLLLAAWGVADRRLAGGSRAGQGASDAGIGAAARAGQGDISSSRFGIWSNTLALITANPGSGVGFGHFNFAWTLTPFPGRPTAFFDHTHNLPLQL